MATISEEYQDYKNALDNLRINSKPLINMLTILAEEKVSSASDIVRAVEERVLEAAADQTLPVLYVLDSIVKNLRTSNYVQLFEIRLPQIFATAFNKVDERTRSAMFKLRQTWAPCFSNLSLYNLDTKIHQIDPAWPITAKVPEVATGQTIHINPNFPPRSNTTPTTISTPSSEEIRLTEFRNQLTKMQKNDIENISTRTRNQQTHDINQHGAMPHPKPADFEPSLTNGQQPSYRMIPIERMQEIREKTEHVLNTGLDGELKKKKKRRKKKKPTRLRRRPSQTLPQIELISQSSSEEGTDDDDDDDQPLTIHHNINGTTESKLHLSVTTVRPADSTSGGTDHDLAELFGGKDIDYRDTSKQHKSTANPIDAQLVYETNAKRLSLAEKKFNAKEMSLKDYQGTLEVLKQILEIEVKRLTTEDATASYTFGTHHPIASTHPHHVQSGHILPSQIPIVPMQIQSRLTPSAFGQYYPAMSDDIRTHVMQILNSVGPINPQIMPTGLNNLSSNILPIPIHPTFQQQQPPIVPQLPPLIPPQIAATLATLAQQQHFIPPRPQINPTIPTWPQTTTALVNQTPVSIIASAVASLTKASSTNGALVRSTNSPQNPSSNTPPPTSTVQNTSPTLDATIQQLFQNDPIIVKRLQTFFDHIHQRELERLRSNLPPITTRLSHDPKESIIEIDGKTYGVRVNHSHCITLYGQKYDFYCDLSSKQIRINNKHVFTMGDKEHRIKLPDSGGRDILMMYMGRQVDVWLDSYPYELRTDTPPKYLNVNNRNIRIQIDSSKNEIYINERYVANLDDQPRLIQVTHQDNSTTQHEIRFTPPPKTIMIDGQPKTMRYDLKFPCIEIDGKFFGIRFTGPPREIYVDNTAHRVPFDSSSTRIHLGKRAHEIAWGGPGFEVIIDGRPYEIHFDQLPREIYIGGRPHFISIHGQPPEVKILDELPFLDTKGGVGALTALVQLFNSRQQTLNIQEIEMFLNLLRSGLLTPDDTTLLFSNNDDNSRRGVGSRPSPKRLHDDDEQYFDGENGDRKRMKSSEKFDEDNYATIPDLTEANLTMLKKKHVGIVQQLYLGIFQCRLCGLRFTSKQKLLYTHHLDWHYRENRQEKELGTSSSSFLLQRSRGWYCTLQEWTEYEETVDENELLNQNSLALNQNQNDGTGDYTNTLDMSFLTNGTTAGITNDTLLALENAGGTVSCPAASDQDDTTDNHMGITSKNTDNNNNDNSTTTVPIDIVLSTPTPPSPSTGTNNTNTYISSMSFVELVENIFIKKEDLISKSSPPTASTVNSNNNLFSAVKEEQTTLEATMDFDSFSLTTVIESEDEKISEIAQIVKIEPVSNE
ncbi:unnamed protein product [Didymodactylos carnosus]|uniref:CID domain-containing protein n=1 Tax=Didymodactylos carnosus TaxID=1234261 RepID=A0A813TEZ7_9BILA|nr:unnamed protein product [Didymodactylos carnosus]CAF3593640.1 unnamed protein product [Didymodactylos carnosus]CAF4058611.1 unnamed protein product [Didymodactylos carnosus]